MRRYAIGERVEVRAVRTVGEELKPQLYAKAGKVVAVRSTEKGNVSALEVEFPDGERVWVNGSQLWSGD